MENNSNNSIFWIELNKIVPNPYQPRIEFNEDKLKDLSRSIKQYGVLQPIVVSRIEKETAEGGLASFYEIIAGERRFRASKMAGLEKIPAIIREGEQTDREKLELAIIENLQREDLNPVDKARSFEKLVSQFGLKHAEVAEKMGKSREYVSNSLRLLLLPDQMLSAVNTGRITEGHTRPLLMLKDRVDEQLSLFKEITTRRLTVREAEKIARSVAVDKIRKKKSDFDPEIKDIENKLSDRLGTKVSIEKKQVGGKVTIEYFSQDDLQKILNAVKNGKNPGTFTVGEDIKEPEVLPESAAEKFDSNFSPNFTPEVQTGLEDLQKEINTIVDDAGDGDLKEEEYKSYYTEEDQIEVKKQEYVENDVKNFSALKERPDIKQEIDYVNSKTEFERPVDSNFSNDDKTYQAFLEARKSRLESENKVYSENVEKNYGEQEPIDEIDKENILVGGLGMDMNVNDNPDKQNIEKLQDNLDQQAEAEIIIGGGDGFVPKKVYEVSSEDKRMNQKEKKSEDDIYNLNNFSI